MSRRHKTTELCRPASALVLLLPGWSKQTEASKESKRKQANGGSKRVTSSVNWSVATLGNLNRFTIPSSLYISKGFALSLKILSRRKSLLARNREKQPPSLW